MKTIKRILIILLVLNVFISVAQNKNVNTNDQPLRQSLAAKYLKENFFDYKTAEAKASHAIILKAFENKPEVINLNLKCTLKNKRVFLHNSLMNNYLDY